MVKKLYALLLVFALCAAANAAEAESPHAPRLVAGHGALAGGFRTISGDAPSFRLFRALENGDELRQIGHFHGRLVGVALDDNGALLALTEDGSLARYGDDIEPLAEPDARWNMAALFWLDGAPLAFTIDNDALYPVRLADGKWTQTDRPVTDLTLPARVDGMVLGNTPHLIIASYADDLSGGALRHIVKKEETWQELPPLPVGDTTAFAAIPAVIPRTLTPDSPEILPAVVALRPGQKDVAFHAWSESKNSWTRLPLPEALEEALRTSGSFAAAAGGNNTETAWLIAGETGAFLTPAGNSPAEAALRVAAAPPPESGWSRWSGLLTLVGLACLVGIYCRRSRAASLALPGRPPDLLSRAAALAADWLIVSAIMTLYHFANGDINILPRLLNLQDVETLFWINLAGLIAFTAIFETLFGRTPGKYFAGLRVRSAFGGAPLFLQLLVRNIFRVVDMFPLPIGFPGLVGVIAALLGKRRMRVGDMMARTVVLRHCPLEKRDFLLASASPRRMELMNALNLKLRAEAMEVDETIPGDEEAPDAVTRLSQAKAKAAAKTARPGEIIIAADTIVLLDDKILGKPKDAEEAKQMLAALSGRSHQVFTGVTVWDTATGQGVTEYEETEVEFRQLADFEIMSYIAGGEPMDKAGAYGVQSGFLIKQVRGSLSNVVGLPMEKLHAMLSALDS